MHVTQISPRQIHNFLDESILKTVKAINDGSVKRLSKIVPIELGIMRLAIDFVFKESVDEEFMPEICTDDYRFIQDLAEQASGYFYGNVYELIMPKEKSAESLMYFLQHADINDIDLLGRLGPIPKINKVLIDAAYLERANEETIKLVDLALTHLYSMSDSESATALCQKFFDGKNYGYNHDDDARDILIKAAIYSIDGIVDKSVFELLAGKLFSEIGILTKLKRVITDSENLNEKTALVELFLSNYLREPKISPSRAIQNFKKLGIDEEIIKQCQSAKKEYISTDFGL